MPTYYKLTGPNGEPLHGGSGNWPLPGGDQPGAWREECSPDEIIPCSRGLHLCRPGDLTEWVLTGAIVWEAEPGDTILSEPDKVVTNRARLVRRVGVLDNRTLRLFAADCAESCLPAFEAAYPNDKRPREAIEMARRFANGTATEEQRSAASSAARYAASSAAYYAARYAASSAASSAAYYAADSAADSAASYAADSAAEQRHGEMLLSRLAGQE